MSPQRPTEELDVHLLWQEVTQNCPPSFASKKATEDERQILPTEKEFWLG